MNIRDAILILTKSQPELRQRLAEYLGVAMHDITDWESGKSAPSKEISQAIAEKYNIA
ncbi:MAG TPA: helix-turn-helix transcriptional regulator [Candidatus Scatovicinus merdipullorum]|nr:helix-turn-helix transcriptional regulator [Candidatus Scatovicinus merdipullorum]